MTNKYSPISDDFHRKEGEPGYTPSFSCGTQDCSGNGQLQLGVRGDKLSPIQISALRATIDSCNLIGVCPLAYLAR